MVNVAVVDVHKRGNYVRNDCYHFAVDGKMDITLHHVHNSVVVHSSSVLNKLNYCKRGNFHVGVIFAFFTILPYSRKFPPRENKTRMTLLKKYE